MFRSVLGPSANRRNDRQCHSGVRDVVAVRIDRMQTPLAGALTVNVIGTEIDLCSHVSKHIGKSNVALHTVLSDAIDSDRPPCDRTQREKVGSTRCIAFNDESARRPIGRLWNEIVIPSRATLTPNCFIKDNVMSTYGCEINVPSTETLSPWSGAISGAAINKPLRNWLETSAFDRNVVA